MFREGIFNEYVHHETVGPDIEDIDHAGTQTQHQPSEPELTLTQASNTNTNIEEV